MDRHRDPVMAARVVARIQDACVPAGLDLVQPLQVGWYNQAVDPAYALPDFGRPDALALVIGNTRALWPRLLAAMDQDPGLAADPDPVDRYCEGVVRAALAGLDVPCEVRFSYERPPRRVAMQRLAHVAGLAHLSSSHLSVHPVYGPWIALRAAVVVDAPGPSSPAPALASPCDCSSSCGPLLARALATARQAMPTAGDIEAGWLAWLAVRDACPVGRDHRYSDDQIRYHYIKDRRGLKRRF